MEVFEGEVAGFPNLSTNTLFLVQFSIKKGLTLMELLLEDKMN